MRTFSDWVISDEVANALQAGGAVVALESTLIVHGLPAPQNLEVAQVLEEIVRDAGATPATIGVVSGVPHVGLTHEQISELARRPNVRKLAPRDLAAAAVSGESGATTVSSTAFIAHSVGITVFATGGLGGVHRGASENFDESNDLTTLADTPIVIVCAGVKSILDVPATLERLETLGVCVVGYQTNKFPGFYLRETEFELEWRCQEVSQIVAIAKEQREIGLRSALVVANPIASGLQLDPTLHQRLLVESLAAAESQGITGKAMTPFLLDFFHSESNGQSLAVNVEVVKSNAALAAKIAVAQASTDK